MSLSPVQQNYLTTMRALGYYPAHAEIGICTGFASAALKAQQEGRFPHFLGAFKLLNTLSANELRAGIDEAVTKKAQESRLSKRHQRFLALQDLLSIIEHIHNTEVQFDRRAQLLA